MSEGRAGGAGKRVPTLAEVEKTVILRALEIFEGDKMAVAHALGISKTTLYRRLDDWGLGFAPRKKRSKA